MLMEGTEVRKGRGWIEHSLAEGEEGERDISAEGPCYRFLKTHP